MAHHDEKYDHDDLWQVVYEEGKDNDEPFWGVHGQYVTINSNKASRNGGSCQTVYSNKSFNCLKYKNCKIRWKIKMDTFTSNGYTMVGVTDNTNYANTYCRQGNRYYIHYANNSNSTLQSSTMGSQSWDNEKWGQGDEIIVELNIKDRNIAFYKNDKLLGVAFHNIDVGDDINYYLTVELYSDHHAVSLKSCMVSGLIQPGSINSIHAGFDKLADTSSQFIDQIGKLDKNINIVKFDQISDVNDLLLLEKRIDTFAQQMNKLGQAKNDLDKTVFNLKKKLENQLKPNVKNYEKWDIMAMLIWICSLDDGKYKRYSKSLKDSFIKNEVTGQDLPDMTRQDLTQFGVTVFKDRVQLEKYFQSLGDVDMDNNEGSQLSTAK